MPISVSVKNAFDPAYALVGAADYAVTTVRESLEGASNVAVSLRDELQPEQVQTRIRGRFSDVREQLAALPALATERYEVVSDSVERAYDELAKTYVDMVDRGVQVTRETVDQGRFAVASARKVAVDTQDSTVATVFGARKEAAKGVGRIAGRVSRGAEDVEDGASTAVRSNAAKEGAVKRPNRSAVAKKSAATRKANATKSAPKKAATRKPAAKKSTAKTTAAKTTAAKTTTASSGTTSTTAAKTTPAS